MHDYELLYFPARGRAEHIRLLFAFKGIPFTEIAPSDWPKQKPTTPFGQVPVLTERGEGADVDDGPATVAHEMGISFATGHEDGCRIGCHHFDLRRFRNTTIKYSYIENHTSVIVVVAIKYKCPCLCKFRTNGRFYFFDYRV